MANSDVLTTTGTKRFCRFLPFGSYLKKSIETTYKPLLFQVSHHILAIEVLQWFYFLFLSIFSNFCKKTKIKKNKESELRTCVGDCTMR